MSHDDLEKLETLEINSSFDYELEGSYYCYIISNEKEMDKYKKILKNNLINYHCEDISDKVIRSEYDISYIKNHIDEDNYFIYDMFIEDFEIWLRNNLDIDIILDIINVKGMSGLREIDKQFLKDNHNL
jgi:hypothetical protein